VKLRKQINKPATAIDEEEKSYMPYRDIVRARHSQVILNWIDGVTSDAEITRANIQKKLSIDELDEWIGAASRNMDIRHIYAALLHNSRVEQSPPV